MSRLSGTVFFSIAVCLSGSAFAGGAPAPVRAEIESLLVRLELSQCEFNRNGTWYRSGEARAHLFRKLESLENKVQLHSAEAFIDLAGTASSMSGQAYQVRCGDGTPVPSAQWLKAELAAVRGAPVKRR